MEGEAQTVDVTQILQAVRDEIAEKGYQNDMLEFSEIAPADASRLMNAHAVFNRVYLEDRVGRMLKNKDIIWYRPLTGNALACFIKRVIRKLTSFLMVPIAEDANRFNESAVDAFSQITAYIDMQDLRIEELEKRIAELERESR